VEAEEALFIGLADRVVDPEDLHEEAMHFAETWARGPTLALAAAKRAINEGWGMPLDEALALESEAFGASFATEDAREGVAAFLTKREPEFGGR
jgi:enoyl-CoA hydratase/carnithine racemase